MLTLNISHRRFLIKKIKDLKSQTLNNFEDLSAYKLQLLVERRKFIKNGNLNRNRLNEIRQELRSINGRRNSKNTLYWFADSFGNSYNQQSKIYTSKKKKSQKGMYIGSRTLNQRVFEYLINPSLILFYTVLKPIFTLFKLLTTPIFWLKDYIISPFKTWLKSKIKEPLKNWFSDNIIKPIKSKYYNLIHIPLSQIKNNIVYKKND